MPIEPAEKARMRMFMNHFNRELFKHVRFLDSNLNTKDAKIKKELEKTKKLIVAHLDSIAVAFSENKKMEYMFGGSFTLLDAALLPLLWRLKFYELETKKSWSNMMKYAETQFSSESFVNSLTPAERNMK